MKKNLQNSTTAAENSRAAEFFYEHQVRIFKSTDRLFAVLMPLQWLAAVAMAWFVTPLTWNGIENKTHPHLWAAIIIGGVITSLPVYLAVSHSGATVTRYTIAISQILMSSLLIHVTGGRIETHFHIFGSLAFLSFYRDWRVLVPATLITAVDHIFRGWFFPQSIYGVLNGGEWRWLEHAAWVIFEDVFLIVLCNRSIKEMWEIAQNTAARDDSEARYRAVVEQMTEGIFQIEPKTLQILECNEAFARMLGYENAEEVKNLKATDFDLAKPYEIEMMTKILREEQRSISTERKYRKKDGSLIYVEIIGRCVNNGEDFIYYVNARDITERKRVEAEAKRLALVAKKTQNSVVITDPKLQIIWVNEGFTRLSGYSFEESLGKHPFEINQGSETSPETIESINNALEQQQPFIGELFNYRKDGTGYWVSISIMPIHGKRGNLKGYIGVETDITERKKMEEALRQAHDEMEQRVLERTGQIIKANEAMQNEVSERKLAQHKLNEAKQFLDRVIENVPNLIFVKDARGKYILANRAFATMYGTTINSVIGKTDAELLKDPKEVERYHLADKQIIEDWQEKVNFEERFTDANGVVHWLQTVKRPLFGDSGVEYILGIATDMTERKNLESQLRHAQKLESIGQLAAGIAHEINTPTQYVGDNTRFVRDAFTDINVVLEKYGEFLTSAKNGEIKAEIISEIENEIETADLEYLVDEVPKAIQQSLEGVSRIAKIVQSMKDFAHPGTKEMQSVDLNRAIESTITVARNEWKYVAEMETNFDVNLPPVPCLLGEFNQVILNMVINASHAIADVVGDASQNRGKITISTTRVNDDWAEIRISDTGTGIPVSAQEHIFDPFFTTKEVGKGTGQGLAISHSVVVEKHNGKLGFETEQGKGTTFIIQMPLNVISTPQISE